MDTERFIRLRTLFDRAMERPEAEREAFLRQACGNDEDVLEEALALLRVRGREDHYLSRPVVLSPTLLEAGAAPSVSRIGPYRLERLLGRGGMGEVWQAIRDDGTFRKTVAIKIVLVQGDNARLIERFQQERQLLASLDHPNIARILDGGCLEDGRPYTVMEYVEGMPVDRYCRERRLDIDGCISLFIEICGAVEYLHQNGVIHRDLKPGNILVNTSGSIRLLDFGIARITGARMPAGITAPQELLLTPGYASPEQLSGEPCSNATDVYSLGVVLYQLLTGSLPSLVATRPPSSGICDDLNRPMDVTRTLQKRMMGDLDAIVLKAMEHNPAARYRSARDLAEELRKFLAGLPVGARKYPVFEKVRKWVRRNRVATAVAALVAMLIMIALWQAVRNSKAQMLAENAQAQLSRVLDRLPSGVIQDALPQDNLARLIHEVQQLRSALEELLHFPDPLKPAQRADRRVLLRRAASFLDQTAHVASQSAGLAFEVGRTYKAAADLESVNGGQSVDRAEALHLYAKADYFLASARDGGIVDPLLQEGIRGVEKRITDLGGRVDELASQMQAQFNNAAKAPAVADKEEVPSPALQKRSPVMGAKASSVPASVPIARADASSFRADYQERQIRTAVKVQTALQSSQKMQDELAKRNLTLNTDIVYSEKQMQTCRETAERHAEAGRWQDAVEYLSRADAFADRILKALGR